MKYYCIGIKGTGMSTLAQILFDLGNDVIGYDDARDYKFTEKGLEEREILIYYDHEHPLDKDTIVTYSVAVPEDHPEMKRVKELGLKIKKYSEIMGDVVGMFKSIGVSGTHGKTTTSTMIKTILENSIGCNYFIGAGDGKASLEKEYFVVESDEFNRHFLDYHPMYAIITNIEAEHLECYKDIDDIRESFEKFANQTSRLVICNGDNEEVRKINFLPKAIYYGFGFNNDVVIRNLKLETDASRFDIEIKGEFYGSFEIPLFGKHMVQNATAAIIMAKELGIEKDIIYNSLKNFENAERRFAISKVGNTTIIDDYAHHPTEIKSTLEAVRQKYPNKRIVVVFKPNTYSRTRDFKDDFITALNVADKAYLTEIDSNREYAIDYPGVTSKMIVEGLRDGDMISEETISKLGEELDSVICFMSCASISHLIDSFKIYVNSLEDN
ncbi:MAG: UDP-N-acetylmuramate--L-alanine ligase [Bacilli bacterium]|nr:UDP-N-acetylmuramate--L-alanine ligase [Bacilli bacterium]MBR6137129.1 UDP-N-acetylmuramate--L-alanine ligase [Bacilli bacterium]MBR6949629.1 UDP-N-acetylmuramate--L-alanine ligase [Bacilli bacterium]